MSCTVLNQLTRLEWFSTVVGRATKRINLSIVRASDTFSEWKSVKQRYQLVTPYPLYGGHLYQHLFPQSETWKTT